MQCILIFLKSFDKVNHGLLFSKLQVKLCGSFLCWMGSYLTDISETIHCHSGVPYGSNLGFQRSAWYF
jgi:hypothetical protein